MKSQQRNASHHTAPVHMPENTHARCHARRLSNRTGLVGRRIPSTLLKAVAGLPPERPTHFYLGSLYGVISTKGTSDADCNNKPEKTSVVHGKPSFQFTVSITNGNGDGDSVRDAADYTEEEATAGSDRNNGGSAAERGIVRVVDVAAVAGSEYSPDEPSNRHCKMASVARLPHQGRWLNISEQLARRGKYAILCMWQRRVHLT